MTKMRAIKGFDANLRCRGFQFQIGQTYRHDGAVAACSAGFHAIPEDAHIFAINKREFIARNCPRPEPEPVISEHAKQMAALVIGGLLAIALAVWGL